MFSFKNHKHFVLAIFVLLLFGSQIQAQVKSLGGRGVIVGKGGAAYRTNTNGQCQLVIPDWLFERIKKAPQKYTLKIAVSKLPQKFLESKLSENAKPQGVNDTPFKFSYNITNGNKLSKGDFSTLINKSNIGAISTKKFGLSGFSLSNPNNANVDVTLNISGEPVPGAEIYVELEPDDEP